MPNKINRHWYCSQRQE